MPSWALDRCVEVTFSAPMTGPRPSRRGRAGFDVGAVEVDQRELGGDEDTRPEGQHDADAEQHHSFTPYSHLVQTADPHPQFRDSGHLCTKRLLFE